jgi:RHS repeat-associated protein
MKINAGVKASVLVLSDKIHLTPGMLQLRLAKTNRDCIIVDMTRARHKLVFACWLFLWLAGFAVTSSAAPRIESSLISNVGDYLNPNTGRFWSMDSYDGKSQDPFSLHKYLYCQNDPVDGWDPSGHEDLVSMNCSMSIQSSLVANVSRTIFRAYAKNLKDRQWVIWRVECKKGPYPSGLFEHTFVWVQNIKNKRAYGYHVFADILDMIKSRKLKEYIPGVFVILPQVKLDKFGSWDLPIQSKTPVMVLTTKQFVVWNAINVGWNAMEIVGDAAFGGIPYMTDFDNCKSFTDKAISSAIAIGLVPF